MATYPLATLACTIDSTGISAPGYSDIYASLQASFQSIYGSDIYIESDSQDGQWLALLAQIINDGNQADVTTFTGYSPSYAQGAALSSQVKINGLRRDVSSNSTVPVDVGGVAGTIITSGVVQDTNKNLWNLPETVTIPLAGTVEVTATAQNTGAIAALADTVTTIYNPQPGWQSVNNPAAATPGDAVETDAALRQRQSTSTSLSALTPLQAISAAIGNVSGIGRYKVYENPTGTVDSNGIPAHSIAVVAEGGDVTTIAQTIEQKKSPGTGTYGTTSITVTDPAGVPIAISFFEMTEVAIITQITVVPLTGYVSTTKTLISGAVVKYLSGFSVGQDSYLGKLFGPANLSGDAATSSSGQTQAELDVLSNTYNLPIQNIYQGRGDMLVTAGPYSAGTTTISVANVASLAAGRSIIVNQSDGSQLNATITSITGNAVTFTPAIATGKTIATGAQVLVNGDLSIAFNEGAQCVAADVTVLP
ncbi:putative phage protein gp47/JayE [Paraburkholderia tropica]|uniref:baseplate J/gp47 family protein n=1 Tax=Paraburkholderia tropica TaxID=92647 RepID=UPI001610B677|nr:baseplate J/gp47 family protein [Paraburkholderia tropica]MBB3004351.1 putative phage protein gp47/JayE [Paraburkholderia tropica]